jgi:hypothetical protein
MGPELIRSCLYDKLRDAQKEELDRLMADAPAGRPQPERLTRKEAAKQAAKQADASHINQLESKLVPRTPDQTAAPTHGQLDQGNGQQGG